MLLSLLSAFLLSPSPPPPPKDLGFARILGVDLMTVGRQLPPVAPPPPVATLMVVITDLFTKWPIAIPVKEVTAKVIAEILLNDVIALYGPMEQLQSDRGTSFMARVVRELCHMFDIQKTYSTAYRAQVNGQTERYNLVLLDALSKLSADFPNKWDKFIPMVLWSSRSSPCENTGYSPFYLMEI